MWVKSEFEVWVKSEFVLIAAGSNSPVRETYVAPASKKSDYHAGAGHEMHDMCGQFLDRDLITLALGSSRD